MSGTRAETLRRTRIIHLARPGEGNRLDIATARALIADLEAARQDPEIACCILTGEGESFCLGGAYWSSGPAAAGRMEFGRAIMDVSNTISRLGKPVLAAVNGDALAGGFSLLVSCDLAIAAEGARVGLPEAAKGLFPFLALAVVRDALPKKLFFDLVYSARLMPAEEARGHQLVNEVLPAKEVLARTIEIADRIAGYNANIVQSGRDLYYNCIGVGPYEAQEMARFAFAAAMGARDEAEPGWNG